MGERRYREDAFAGLYLTLSGLFRKVVIADNLRVVNGVFGLGAERHSGVEILAGVYAFAWQIYGDFSGYSAIAQGVACWLGFDLKI